MNANGWVFSCPRCCTAAWEPVHSSPLLGAVLWGQQRDVPRAATVKQLAQTWLLAPDSNPWAWLSWWWLRDKRSGKGPGRMLLGVPCRSVRKERWKQDKQQRPFNSAAGPTSPAPCLGQTVKQAPAFPPPAARAGQLTRATAHSCRSPLYMFLPSTYFVITSVRNGCDRQGGIVGVTEHQGVGRGQDKGCCVSS